MLKGGEAERLLAHALWHRGYRYRKNHRGLPGSPDIALVKYRIAIFVDGEFWHGKNWEVQKARLKKNRDYWVAKIEENMMRDGRVDDQLRAMGWSPIHIWTQEVLKRTDDCVEKIITSIRSRKI